jgi:hypothetical protein
MSRWADEAFLDKACTPEELLQAVAALLSQCGEHRPTPVTTSRDRDDRYLLSFFRHRARAALRAIERRWAALSRSALARPPFSPPRRPSAASREILASH